MEVEETVEVKSTVSVVGAQDNEEDKLMDKDKSEEKKKERTPVAIERDKTCPFLLRIFVRDHDHHRTEDFTVDRQPLNDELQAYTWKDATLKELSGLVKEVNPDTKARDIRMSFRVIYFDMDGRAKTKDLGEISNAGKGPDDLKTLDDVRFVTGDFLDVAIHKEGKRFAAEKMQNRRGDDDRRDRRGAGAGADRRDWDSGRDNGRDFGRERDRDRERERDRDRNRGGWGGRRDGGRR